MMVTAGGVLYVVATPIGNLEDITQRALRVLAEVDLVAAEDTRRTGVLLQHYAIKASLFSLHEHNEEQRVEALLARLSAGESIALVSDAGTPLISDPGYRLVRAARRGGHAVTPVPGASSLLAALSAAGLPTDRFVFEGFLPAKPAARRRRLEALASEPRTLVMFESSHRIEHCLADLAAIFGGEREAVLARELTKHFETIRQDSLQALNEWVAADADQTRGEFVLMIAGAPAANEDVEREEGLRVMELLAAELPLKKAARLAAELTGLPRNTLYRVGLDRVRRQD